MKRIPGSADSVKRKPDPEKMLWVRVLELGTREALKGSSEALQWLNNNRRSDIGSVLWVCDQVNFSHLQELRHAVNKGDDETKGQLLKRIS